MNELKIYSEEGCRCLVEVLSDTTTKNGEGNDMRAVHVRVVYVLEKGPWRKKDIGEEWQSTAVVGFEHWVGWSLEEPTEKELAYAS